MQQHNHITHLGIVAHQDDLEMVALEGILHSYQQEQPCFGGIVVTDGRGSPRGGKWLHYSDDQMMAIRYQEQEKAAQIGHYASLTQLGIPSSLIKEGEGVAFQESLEQLIVLLDQWHPQVIYTHQPFDRHPTHRATLKLVVAALRALPAQRRPKVLWGGEVWGSLEWLAGRVSSRLRMVDCSHYEGLIRDLLRCFPSQIESGKAYEKAFLGRLQAHATFAQAHALDQAHLLTYLLDLTPFLENSALTFPQFTKELSQEFFTALLQESE